MRATTVASGIDFDGRDAQQAVTRRGQATVTLGVSVPPCVPGAVDFSDELRLRRVEVRDEALQHNLPPERGAKLLGAERLRPRAASQPSPASAATPAGAPHAAWATQTEWLGCPPSSQPVADCFPLGVLARESNECSGGGPSSRAPHDAGGIGREELGGRAPGEGELNVGAQAVSASIAGSAWSRLGFRVRPCGRRFGGSVSRPRVVALPRVLR